MTGSISRPALFWIGLASIILVLIGTETVLIGIGAGIPPAGQPDPREFERQFLERQDEISDYVADLEITMHSINERESLRFFARYPDRFRAEYPASSRLEQGMIAVFNGTFLTQYRPAVQEALSFPGDPNGTFLAYRDYQRFVRDLVRDQGIQALTGDSVDGRHLYRIEVEKPYMDPWNETRKYRSEYQFTSVRAWIDPATMMVEKMELYNAPDLSPLITVQYQNMSVNTGIPESRFEPDLPPGFVIATPPEPMITPIYLGSPDIARTVFGPDLLIPAYLPKGFNYTQGSFFTGKNERSELVFGNASDEIHLIQGQLNATLPYDVPAGSPESITIHGIPATFTSGDPGTPGSPRGWNRVAWQEGNYSCWVLGTPGRNEMVRMAESLGPATDQLIAAIPVLTPAPSQPLTPEELVSIVFPESFMREHDTDPSPDLVDIRIPDATFSESFAADRNYPEFIVYRTIGSGDPVVLFQVPETMFGLDNSDPGVIVINYPASVFRLYGNMSELWNDRCSAGQIPCPAGGST